MDQKDKYYEKGANIYAHTSVPWQQKILADFMYKISPPAGARIVDVGSGIGNNIETLQKYTNELVAVDISEKALSIMRRRFGASACRVKAVVADAQNLPFPDGSFDVVVCTEVIEHCRDVDGAIGECLRILKPGGYIIFSSPNYLNIAGIEKITYEKMHPGTSWDAWGNHEGGRENVLTSLGIISFFKKNNIALLQTRGGDVLRSWVPFLKKRYKFIDKHPFLKAGKVPFIKYFLMNFFILGKKD
jgi:ubiquinone/menaquinone biosynthesis C-methylase UbiE